MGKVKRFIFCTIFCLLFPTVLLGEGILLKSGKKVEGMIIEKTDKYVKLEFEGTELVYYNDEIASIEQADAAGQSPVNPQPESFYKAYTATLKTPENPEAGLTKEQQARSSQAAAAVVNEPAPDLSQLPSKYQEMIQSALSAAQGTQAGQPGGGGDLSQLPPEYREALKEITTSLQNADLGFPEQE